MKSSVRKCLLRKIACQNAARSVEMSLPVAVAKKNAVLEIDTDRWRVEAVLEPAPEHRSLVRPPIIRPQVRQDVLDYLLAKA